MGRDVSEWEPMSGAGTRPAERAIKSRDGAESRIENRAGDEVLSVRDRSGALIFEHHGASGRSVIYAPSGDLELRADHGSVSVVARDAIRLRGEQEVAVTTRSLSATAAKADVTLDEGRLVARAMRSTIEDARHVVDRLTVEARRIIERSKDVYRDVEELSQTRAGRMRHVVSSTFHLLSARAVLKAEDDFKIKSNKIHLA